MKSNRARSMAVTAVEAMIKDEIARLPTGPAGQA
jgi:hypothetical protein